MVSLLREGDSLTPRVLDGLLLGLRPQLDQGGRPGMIIEQDMIGGHTISSRAGVYVMSIIFVCLSDVRRRKHSAHERDSHRGVPIAPQLPHGAGCRGPGARRRAATSGRHGQLNAKNLYMSAVTRKLSLIFFFHDHLYLRHLCPVNFPHEDDVRE